MITLEQGVELVWHAFTDMFGGEIYVKKIPSMSIVDIAKSIQPENDLKIVGIRPGEKLHEQMIGSSKTLNLHMNMRIITKYFQVSMDGQRQKRGLKMEQGSQQTLYIPATLTRIG